MKARTLINTAEEVLATMREKGLIDESRTGGYMTVLSPRDRGPTPLVVTEVGELTDPKKIEKYYRFSQEKATRLLLNAMRGHHLSWQSRDPDKDKWGGAIVAGDYILSFSGLPELADEALMLAVARRLKILSLEQCQDIAAISSNEIFGHLVKN